MKRPRLCIRCRKRPRAIESKHCEPCEEFVEAQQDRSSGAQRLGLATPIDFSNTPIGRAYGERDFRTYGSL